MIETKYPTDAFEDAIEATVFMATVHVREGELALPERIREHLADGPVIVHLMRGEDDVAVHEATLTSRSTLAGIEWPDDVEPRTSLTVLCPRGGASHDIGVLLPKSNVDWPDADLPATPEPEPAAEQELEQADAPDVDPVESMTEREAGALAFILTGLAEFEQTAFTADSDQPGPAEYTIPGTAEQLLAETEHADDCTGCDGPGVVPCAADRVVGDLAYRDGEPIKYLGAPEWPGDEDSEERTDLLPAIPAPDPTEGDVEPGSVFSAALVAVRTPEQPKPEPGWLARKLRPHRAVVLSVVVAIVVTWTFAYVVMGR